LLAVSCLNVNAADISSIKEAPEIKVMVSGKPCIYNDVPIKVNGSIFLPLKELLVSIGVQNDEEHIMWNPAESSLTIIKDSDRIVLKPGTAAAILNGVETRLDAPPIYYKEKLYIYAGFVNKFFSRPIIWDGSISTLFIKRAEKGEEWIERKDLPFTLEPISHIEVFKWGNGSTTNIIWRDRPGRVVAMGNKIYAINALGRVAEYDPIIDTWTVKKDIDAMKNSKGDFKLVAVDNKIYIIGNNYNEILEYDPVADRTVFVTKFKTDRKVENVAAVNGNIYLMGGTDMKTEKKVDIIEEYNIAEKKWTRKNDYPLLSSMMTFTTLNNKIFGLFFTDAGIMSIEEYDTKSDCWSPKSQIQGNIYGLTMESLNDKIYMIDGEHNYNRVMEYNPRSNKLSTNKTGVPRPRYESCITAVNGKIYIIGGYIDDYEDQNKEGIEGLHYVDEYTPPRYIE